MALNGLCKILIISYLQEKKNNEIANHGNCIVFTAKKVIFRFMLPANTYELTQTIFVTYICCAFSSHIFF